MVLNMWLSSQNFPVPNERSKHSFHIKPVDIQKKKKYPWILKLYFQKCIPCNKLCKEQYDYEKDYEVSCYHFI